MRWELSDKNPIKLVRVRGGTKRLQSPRILAAEEFCRIPPLIREPYRTQVWVAGFLGLRASEIMSLRWSDFDFDDLSLLVQRSVVHGRVADVKTEYSKDRVPLDPALAEILFKYREQCCPSPEGWLFANPTPVTDPIFGHGGPGWNGVVGATTTAALGMPFCIYI